MAHRNTRIEAEQRGARTLSRWSVSAAAAAAAGAGEQRLVSLVWRTGTVVSSARGIALTEHKRAARRRQISDFFQEQNVC